MMFPFPHFSVQLFGDLVSQNGFDEEYAFATLAEAFNFIEKEVCLVLTEENPEDPANPNRRYHRPDPEDDRILIWEVTTPGQKKVVWHFSGWHWPHERSARGGDDYNPIQGRLEQGKLPGHEKSLYEETDP